MRIRNLWFCLLVSRQSFPALYFLPANKKKPTVPYTGARQTGDMIQYLFQHRTTPVGPGSDLFNALRQDQQRPDDSPAQKAGKDNLKSGKKDAKSAKGRDDDEDDDEL
jgi:hypothetical protein